MCARSDFTELGDESGEQGRVACLPERVYAKLAENVMLKRLFPAGCYEGGCGSDVLWLKTVLVRPVVGANELLGLLGVCEEGMQGDAPGQEGIFCGDRLFAIGCSCPRGLQAVRGGMGGHGRRTAGIFCLVEDVVEVFLVPSEGGGEAERGETRSRESTEDKHDG